MTKEDIIRMAREAGIARLPDNWGDGWWQADSTAELEQFAALVAAVAKAEEREALCKLGEGSRYSHQYVHSFLNTIRARGNTQ